MTQIRVFSHAALSLQVYEYLSTGVKEMGKQLSNNVVWTASAASISYHC